MDCDSGTSTSGNGEEFECVLIQYKSLRSSGYRQLAEALAKDIEKKGIVPWRIDYTGAKRRQTFQEYIQRRPWRTIPDVPSLVHSTQLAIAYPDKEQLRCSRLPANSLLPKNRTVNHVTLLTARELGVCVPEDRLHSTELISSIDRHFRIVGHMDKVYNVRFDRTDRYAITAADDGVLKVWDLSTALLRYTFRGSNGVIVDFAISPCNQLLVSPCKEEKRLRIWSLKNGTLLYVVSHHTAEIVGAKFLPKAVGKKRYLMSYGTDCNVIFYTFDVETLEFEERLAMIYNVRTSNNAKVFSGSHSACGNWASVGDSQGLAHMFHFEDGAMRMKTEFKCLATNDKVDSMEWCHNGPAFAVASTKHHIGRIWRLLRGEWHFIEFQPLQDEDTIKLFASSKMNYGVSSMAWSPDDRFLVVSGIETTVRIYDACTGSMHKCLKGHTEEVFHLHFSPVHPHVLISSGHDGLVIWWDTNNGKQLRKVTNDYLGDNQVYANSAVLDVAVSSDGTRLATTDDLGRITVYGYGTSDLHQTPREQFFRNDYGTLIWDPAGFVIDEVTGLAPHLNPPSTYANVLLEPLPEKWQRKVPGREPSSNPDICPWLTRDIIPKLDSTALLTLAKKMEEASEASYEHWDFDRSFAMFKPIADDAPSQRPAAVRTRQRTQLPTMQEMIQQQDARRAGAAMDGYRSEDDVSYSESEDESDREEAESDSEAHGSDSDYSGDESRPRQERRGSGDTPQVTTASGRRVKPRVLDNQGSASPEKTPRRTNRRVILESDEDGQEPAEDQAGQAGPSSQSQKAPLVQKPKKVKVVEDEYLRSFPKSMQLVKPTKFPYVAQIGDDIVYCKQGHMAYIDRVEELKLYPVSAKMRPSPELAAEVFCQVDDLKYTRKPYRLTVLRLAVLNRGGEATGRIFTIRFHDLENCPDFLVLRYHYDLAVSQALKEGDEMEAVLDGLWWTGTVTKRQPWQQDYPTSKWNSLSIRWDNGDDDIISPWECQPKSPGRKSTYVADLDDEVQLALCPSLDTDWPGTERPAQNKAACCERLSYALNQLSGLDNVRIFAYPVNLSAFPTYAQMVDYCIDLQTINERLLSGFYRRLKAVQHDIRMVAAAAEQFNVPDSTLVYNSRRLVEALIRFSSDLFIEKEDIQDFYDTMFDLPPQEVVEYQQRRRIDIDPEVLEMAKSSQAAEAREAGWIRETRKILEDIFRHSSAKHFLDQGTATDQNIRNVLSEVGDLNSVLNDLTTFVTPSLVVERVDEILMACRDSIDDARSRVRDCTQQVKNMVVSRMAPVITEYNGILNGDGIGMRLRKKAPKPSAYDTRSGGHSRERRSTRRNQEEPGFYKQMMKGVESPPHRDRTNRSQSRVAQTNSASSSRRGSSEAVSVRGQHDVFGRRRSRDGSMRAHSDDDEEEHQVVAASPSVKEEPSSAESSETGSESPYSSEEEQIRPVKKRKGRGENEELMEELQELAEDAEETLEHSRRRSVRNRKRKRFSSGSGDEPPVRARNNRRSAARSSHVRRDSGSNDENLRRGGLRGARAKKKYEEVDSEDGEEMVQETVSQRGRVRRTRRLS